MEIGKHSFDHLQQEFEENDQSFSKYYQIQSIIGQGAFGIVLSCLEIQTNKNYAVKIIIKRSFNTADLNKLRYEAETLSLLCHPNIVKYKDVLINFPKILCLYFYCCMKRVETETKIFVIMELIRGGSLHKFIEERKKKEIEITDLEASIIMKSVLRGVSYMHKNNIVHRDLKPEQENILIDDLSDLSTVKLTDFGLSVQFGREFTRQLTQSSGTLVFMAPEIVFHHPYSMTVDIWSCGIILYLLLSKNKHPLYSSEDTHEEYMEKLKNPKWEFPPNFSKYAKDLFMRLIKQDPSDRYRAEEALNHPWITRKKNVVPQTISEQRKTFYSQITLTNIIAACMILSFIRKKDMPKIPLAYINLLEKINELSEFGRLEKKSLSAISPHSPFHDSPCEETKELSINMRKIESDRIVEKPQGFSEIYSRKVETLPNNFKKGHIKHDSFGNSSVNRPQAKKLTLKVDKDLDVRTQASKTFYSPQKKIESSPKKNSTPGKEKESIGTNSVKLMKLEKAGTTTLTKTSGLSPRKK